MGYGNAHDEEREGSSADAVAILALLRSADNADYVETLVVQQFRPPSTLSRWSCRPG